MDPLVCGVTVLFIMVVSLYRSAKMILEDYASWSSRIGAALLYSVIPIIGVSIGAYLCTKISIDLLSFWQPFGFGMIATSAIFITTLTFVVLLARRRQGAKEPVAQVAQRETSQTASQPTQSRRSTVSILASLLTVLALAAVLPLGGLLLAIVGLVVAVPALPLIYLWYRDRREQREERMHKRELIARLKALQATRGSGYEMPASGQDTGNPPLLPEQPSTEWIRLKDGTLVGVAR